MLVHVGLVGFLSAVAYRQVQNMKCSFHIPAVFLLADHQTRLIPR